MTDPSTALRIASRYLHGGRLATMPRAGARRLAVLEQVVQRFEPGVRYSEIEVNRALVQVWPDVAALRRYLVDAALLSRRNGEYWRTGGPVEV